MSDVKDSRRRGSTPVIDQQRREPVTPEEIARRQEINRVLREDAEKREAAKVAREVALETRAIKPDYDTLLAFAWHAAMDTCMWNECPHCEMALALFGLTREDL